MSGAALTHGLAQKILGLDRYFNSFLPKAMQDYSAGDNPQGKAQEKMFQHMMGSLNSIADAQNFYLENHPRRGFLASAPSWTGEQVAMLPLYEAINPVTEAAGTALMSGAEKVAPSLTKALVKSKIGQFVGRRLMDASTGFMAGKSMGESTKQSEADAIAFAAGGGLIEGGIPTLKGGKAVIDNLAGFDRPPATDAEIKEWTANNLAMGGRPFVEAIHAQAQLEEGQDRILKDAENRNIPPGTAEKVSANRAKRESDDPTTHNLVKAERYTLNSLAKRHYGAEYGDLSRGKREIIKARRIELMHEAEFEMPSLVPDLNKMEVQSDHEKQIAESPAFAKASAYLDEMFPEQGKGGISVINQQQVEANQIMTGIKDSEKKSLEVQSVREQRNSNTKITGEGFASHRVESIAYFKNPNSGSQRLAADGTKIGGRDKRTWNVRMKAENFEQFINTLKEADGDRIHFENPYHRMLFHWANRDSLPQPVRDKLLREMKGYLARQKNPVYASAKEITEQADWNLVHTMQMAQTGRLTSEGNIFRSTQMNGPGTMTQWQGELQTEMEQQEYETLRKSLTLYPESKELLTNAMNALQNSRGAAKTPAEWMQYNAAINQHLKLGGIN